MSDCALDLSPVSAEDVIAITRQVWSSFLGLELTALPGAAVTDEPVMSAVVHISGEWEGAVQLDCPLRHGVVAAGLMFSADPDSLSEEEACDAVGELANIVSGNVKSLLPAPSALSLPSVTTGDAPAGRSPDAAVVCQVELAGKAGPLHVTVWKV
jgi:chemotaxis protein CheX